MNAAAAPAQIAVVTVAELNELADWERKYAERKRLVSAAEKEVLFRRQALAEKVLGLKSADELKAMPPKKVDKLYADRKDAGEWKTERNAPSFCFTKTHEGRYPSWLDLFIQEMGETAAARVKAETPVSYSYAVQVDL